MQKKLSSSLSAAVALSLSLTLGASAYAQQTAVTTVQIAASYSPSMLEFQNLEGVYKLETGQFIEVSESNNRYYTQLRDRAPGTSIRLETRAPVEIFPIKPGVFASRSGSVLTFRNDGDLIIVGQPDLLLRASR